MSGSRRSLVGGGLALCASAVAGRAAARFADPLDTPARPSTRADREPILALAAAGERIVGVGVQGRIVSSQDGGRHWTQVSAPVSVDLVAVHFSSARRGWIVGHDGVVLRSSDGGRSWQRALDGRRLCDLLRTHYAPALHSPVPALKAEAEEALRMAAEGPTKPLLSVWFRDENEGWVVGAFNLVLHTRDGGASWTPWMENIDNPQRLSLHAIDGRHGQPVVVGEAGLVLRADASGMGWRRIGVAQAGSLFGLLRLWRALVVFGLQGKAWRSDDDGQTWTPLRTGISDAINTAAVMPDGRWVFGSAGASLLVTADDGRSFVQAPGPRGRPVYSLLPLGADALVVAGPDGVQRVSLGRTGLRP